MLSSGPLAREELGAPAFEALAERSEQLGMNPIDKVAAYITQEDRLLVFTQPAHPEAGLQVPAGTVGAGEALEDAVLREAREETGLEDLILISFLGTRVYDLSFAGRDETQRRHFFHLEFRGQAPTTWRHLEKDPSGGALGPIEFEFFWVGLEDGAPELSGGLGDLLPKIRSDV